MKTLKIKKLHPDANISKAHEDDAGYDLYAVEKAYVTPAQVCLRKSSDYENEITYISNVSYTSPNICIVDTCLSVEIPPGHVGLIKPRSGLAVKYGIDVLAGVIDSSYRGSIKVALISHNKELVINKGDRIAQLVIQKVENDFDIEYVEELEETERGPNGFGSSGR